MSFVFVSIFSFVLFIPFHCFLLSQGIKVKRLPSNKQAEMPTTLLFVKYGVFATVQHQIVADPTKNHIFRWKNVNYFENHLIFSRKLRKRKKINLKPEKYKAREKQQNTYTFPVRSNKRWTNQLKACIHVEKK